jgi:hypothetical protein
MSEPPAPYEEAISRLGQALSEFEDWALIGGLAIAFRGIPRTTLDIDLLLAIPRIQLPSALDRMREQGFDLDVQKVLVELRDDHLSRIRYGSIRIDLLSAVLGLFTDVVKTASWEVVHCARLRVASPEGLIILKLIAFRPQDQADLEGLIATNRSLNVSLLREWYSKVGEIGDDRWQMIERMLSRGRPAIGDSGLKV